MSSTKYILPDDPDLRPIRGLTGPGSILRPGDPPVDLKRRLDPKNPSDRVLLEAGLVNVDDRRTQQVRSQNTAAALAEADREVESLQRRCSILERERDQLKAAVSEADKTVASLQADLGESQLAEENLRDHVAQLEGALAEAMARLDVPPWDGAAKTKVIAFANRLAKAKGLPKFAGTGALDRALKFLDEQPRIATLGAWK